MTFRTLKPTLHIVSGENSLEINEIIVSELIQMIVSENSVLST